MAMVSLNSNEARALHALQFDANISINKLAKIIGLSVPRAQRVLQQLRQRGLYRPWPLINPFALGYSEFTFYFSIASSTARTKLQALNFLAKHPKVIWWAEVYGEYDLVATIISKDLQEVQDFQVEFCTHTKIKLKKKSLNAITSLSFFSKKYLEVTSRKQQAYCLNSRDRVESSIDLFDRKLLAALCSPGEFSQREISRKLGKPHATVDFRIKRLFKLGIIACFINRIDPLLFGYSKTRALISLRELNKGLRTDFIQYSRSHLNVVNLFECIGTDDFEITLETNSNSQITGFIEDVREKFESSLESIKILPITKHWNSDQFLKHLSPE